MRKLVQVMVVSCGLFSGACKKKETSQPAAGSGAPAAAAKVEEKKASACSPTAWKEPSGLFCVDAPGFTAGEIKKSDDEAPQMKIYFKKPAAEPGKPEVMFDVYWYPSRDASEALSIAPNMESDFKNNTGVDKGDFAGGKGKFFVFSRKDNATQNQLYAVVQGNKHAYSCEATNYEGPLAPEVIAACKSLTPTD